MILGLVAAKENSIRFKNKNKYIYQGKPLFWHSVSPLLESDEIDDVYVITDSKDIKKYCEDRDVNVIWRPKNATRDEDKLINILRFGYYNLNKDYDIVVSIMANCPGHTVDTINDGIKLIAVLRSPPACAVNILSDIISICSESSNAACNSLP